MRMAKSEVPWCIEVKTIIEINVSMFKSVTVATIGGMGKSCALP